MQLKGVNVNNATKLISQHVDSVTCLECCKYFIAPERATCGHTLCHSCWKGRRACPACAVSLDRRSLKRDEPMITLTEHIRELVMAYEKLFDIKLDEFVMEVPVPKKDDPNKNVKEWLTSSDNHFSAPPYSGSQQSTQDILPPITLSTSKVQIHAESNRSLSPKKIAHVVQPQDDWDNIEVLPDTEVIEANKNKQNVVGPMDLEPFYFDENDYSNEHPRRSSRKKDITLNSKAKSDKPVDNDKLGSHDSSGEGEKKLDKVKQNWTNVKKMKKEFSKLNKLNKNKLNVSIEMCKKTQSAVSKQSSTTPPAVHVEEIVIDDNTPNIIDNNKVVASKAKIIPNKIVEEVPGTEEAEAVSSQRILNKNTQIHQSVRKDDYTNNKSKDRNAEEIMNVDEECNNDLNNSNKVQGRVNNNNGQSILATEERNINIAMSECGESVIKIPFIKKSNFQVPSRPEQVATTNQIINNVSSSNPDDIHITIRIGDVVTNITINKKQNDVELKVNTDREIQTSLDPQPVKDVKALPQEVKTTREQHAQTDTQIVSKPVTQKSITPLKAAQILDKTVSTKKNTASAETATAQFEITESVEKELSNIMECDEEIDETHNTEANANSETSRNNTVVKGVTQVLKSNTQVLKSNTQNLKSNTQNLKSNTQVSTKSVKNAKPQTEDEHLAEDIEFDDMDIFNSGSVKEPSVHMLGKSKYTPSEILPTYKTNKTKTQKIPEKRDRDLEEIEEQPSKRQKVDTPHKSQQEAAIQEHNKTTNSPNYDELMGEVFANIDADIIEIKSQKEQKSQKKTNSESQVSQTILQKSNSKNKTPSIINTQNNTLVDINTQDLDNIVVQKESENMFSTVGNALERGNTHVPGPDTQLNIANLLTPRMCEDLAATEGAPVPGSQPPEVVVHCTPAGDDDSDKSVVEETPQKNISNPTSKGRSDSNGNKSANTSKRLLTKPGVKVDEDKAVAAITQGKSLDSQDIGSIINLTDSVMDTTKRQSKDITVAPIRSKTPLTINRFVNQIKHNSTPMARKSLNFTKNENDADADEDITLCPTNNSNIAKNTQEKQFMSEQFENMQNSPVRRPLVARNVVEEKNKKLVIAGSCLSGTEQTNLKILCFKRKWTFVDKYTADLTHLVVSVDEEFKAQRSVKYMCALAAGKWIVAYKWVEKCLESNTLFEEEPFEALDSTGDPGPRRSRLATRKVFEGITFFCMPPFSVLDIDTLKSMLVSAGGSVAAAAHEARAGARPALLLAEPEHTQEDRFMYLAMELSIVPVNYEWALNCLGSYCLCPLPELLLCPASLLPRAAAAWPRELLETGDNEE